MCADRKGITPETAGGTGNLARATLIDGLDLTNDWDVVSVDLNELDNEGICSTSEIEASITQEVTMWLIETPYEFNFIAQTSKYYGWMKKPRLTKEQEDFLHQWKDGKVKGFIETPFLCDSCKCPSHPRFGA